MWNIVKQPKLLILFFGRLFSNFGDGLKFIAISWLTYDQTDSVLMVGGVLAVTTIPGIILTPIAGVWLDKFDRRIIAMTVEFIQCLTLLAWFYTIQVNGIQVWTLYLFTALLAVGQSITMPALFSLIPEVFEKDQVLKVNSVLSISTQAGYLLGSGLGGFIIAFISPTGAILVNGLTYLISGIAIVFLRKGVVIPERSENSKTHLGFLSSFLQTFSYTRTHKDIGILIVMGISTWLVTMVINVLLAPFTKEVLKTGIWGFGILDAMVGIGSIVGSICIGWLEKNFKNQIIGIGFIITGCLLFSFGANNILIIGAILNFLIGITIQITSTFVDTYIQLRVNNSFLGRVSSTIRLGGSTLGPICMYSFATIAQYGSFLIAFSVMAILTIIIGVIAFFWNNKYELDRTIELYSKKTM
ncbi:MFS transporter [Geobacillus sp. Geo 8.1]